MMSTSYDYLADEDINDDPPLRPNIDFLRHSDNTSNDKHDGRNLGLDNPNDPFAFDSDDAMEDNELHMCSNIVDKKFLSNVNVHPAMPITIIPNVPVDLEFGVHEDVVPKPTA